MHAARVPLLGMAVAVALLLAENLGAMAYREQAAAASEASAATGRDVEKQRRLDEMTRAIREACENGRGRCREEHGGSYGPRATLPDGDGPRIREIMRKLEAAQAEVRVLQGLADERRTHSCDFE